MATEEWGVGTPELVRRACLEWILRDAPNDVHPGYAQAMVRDEVEYCAEIIARRDDRKRGWVSLSVRMQPKLLEAVRKQAKKLGVGRDQFVRASVFDALDARLFSPLRVLIEELEAATIEENRDHD